MKYLPHILFCKILLCIFALLIVSSNSYAQTKITLRGSISDSSNNPLSNCVIKVNQQGIIPILYFTNTGQKNSFSINLTIPGKDSVLVSVIHAGYNTVVKKVTVEQLLQEEEIKITLVPLPKTLAEVRIEKDSWIRDDTTFYRVDAYKEGGERKLKDIITKIPGFDIDEQGDLHYNNRIVEKITINGDDLFADKKSLLLNNFPVHVLNTIDAQVNQSGNRLMKGLIDGSKVFVNLGIKKEKLNTAFGDAELGLGTGGKYLFNPVIFGLYKKLNIGIIGGYNNTGNGVGYQQEQELKNDAIRLADNWMMRNNELYTISDFENRHYINNWQWDSRIKINYTHSSKIKSELEFNYLTDTQMQDLMNRSIFFNDSNNVVQNQYVDIRRKPKVLLAKEKTTWSISEKKELIVLFSSTLNNTTGYRNSIFAQDNNLDTTQSELRNQFAALSGELRFSNRVSKKMGYTFFANYSFIQNNQNAFSISSAWPLLYQLNEPSYRQLNLPLENRFSNFEVGIDLHQKTKKGILSNQIIFQSVTSNINTDLFFSSTKPGLTDTTINAYNNSGSYNTNTLKGSSSKAFRIFKLPFLASVDYGISSTSIKENQKKTNITTPVFKIELNQKSKFSEYFEGELTARYSNTNFSQYELSGMLLPLSINTFRQGMATEFSSKAFSSNYILNIKFKKEQSAYLMFSHFTSLPATISSYSFNQFIQLSKDTIVQKSRSQYGLSFGYFPYFKQLKSTTIFINGSLSYNTAIYKQNDRLVYGNLLFQQLNWRIEKNWEKKYFIKLSGAYTRFKNKYPDGDGKIISSGNIGNLKIALNQNLVASKVVRVFLNAESHHSRFPGRKNTELNFIESGCDFSFKKLPLMFTLKAANLLNTRELNTIYVSALSQNFNSIPINPRSLFLSLRYEL